MAKTKFIKEYEKACAKLKRSTDIPDVSGFPERKRSSMIAEHKLETIIEANNEKWVANIADTDQKKWYPFHRVIKDESSPLGFRLSFNDSYYDRGYSLLGARLACCSKELSDYLVKEHEVLYAELRA